jgi:hypothetical protein
MVVERPLAAGAFSFLGVFILDKAFVEDSVQL